MTISTTSRALREEDLKTIRHLMRACRSRHDHQRHRQDCTYCAELEDLITSGRISEPSEEAPLRESFAAAA